MPLRDILEFNRTRRGTFACTVVNVVNSYNSSNKFECGGDEFFEIAQFGF